MKIPENIIQDMIERAHRAAPKECVGIIAGKDDEAVCHYKARNVSKELGHYILHPTDLKRIHADMAQKGTSVFAVYHSHPNTEAYPSSEDVELALSGVFSVIVSIQDRDCAVVRAFTIDRGVITEVPVEKN